MLHHRHAGFFELRLDIGGSCWLVARKKAGSPKILTKCNNPHETQGLHVWGCQADWIARRPTFSMRSIEFELRDAEVPTCSLDGVRVDLQLNTLRSLCRGIKV